MLMNADWPDYAENSETIREKLRQLSDETDLDFAVQLVGEFSELAPTSLAELKEAVAQSDGSRAGRIAHSLKGNCATFGLANLARKMLAVETTCRQGKVVPLESVTELERDYATAADELHGVVQELMEGAA